MVLMRTEDPADNGEYFKMAFEDEARLTQLQAGITLAQRRFSEWHNTLTCRTAVAREVPEATERTGELFHISDHRMLILDYSPS